MRTGVSLRPAMIGAIASLAMSIAMSLAMSLVMTVASSGAALAASCQAFMDNMQRQAVGLAPQFVRPVVVSRGSVVPGAEVRDLVTNHRIDGQLFCDGDRFVRFEAKIHAPFDSKLQGAFEKVQAVAVGFKMNWSAAKTNSVLRRMAREANEYLRASAERGDVFISGKVEEHAGEAGDLAVVWTRSDRSFILVEYRP
ncbi:MAG: hypothetical protein AB7F96_18000 [Beijerinckiaceae bacterium]